MEIQTSQPGTLQNQQQNPINQLQKDLGSGSRVNLDQQGKLKIETSQEMTPEQLIQTGQKLQNFNAKGLLNPTVQTNQTNQVQPTTPKQAVKLPRKEYTEEEYSKILTNELKEYRHSFKQMLSDLTFSTNHLGEDFAWPEVRSHMLKAFPNVELRQLRKQWEKLRFRTASNLSS